MTALIIMRTEQGFSICSDGASYRSDTRQMCGFSHKVTLLPAYSGFLAYRGVASVMPIFEAALDERFVRFDDIVEHADQITRDAAKFVGLIQGQLPDFTIYLGGWSEAREQFESYAISPTDRKSIDGDDMRQAFVVTPLQWCVIAPVSSDAILGSLGLLDEAGDLIVTYQTLPMFVHAARLFEDDVGGAIAGGFLQETLIWRNTSQTTILYRYDDTPGYMMLASDAETADIARLCEARAGQC